MYSIKTLTFALIALFFTTITYAQETPEQEEEDKLSLNEGTLDNQFEYVIQRSNSYQDFKVIKKTWMYALKAHAIDSLKAVHKDLSDTKAIVDSQAIEIADLKNRLANTKTTLVTTKEEKDNMFLLGMPISKGMYKLLMWSAIGLLLILLSVFIYKFRNSNAITKQAKQALAETEEEFEEHRRNALEREQIVRRQLLDEINKHKKNKKDK